MFLYYLTRRLDTVGQPGALYKAVYSRICRSQWPRGLNRGSVAARLLGLWVRIPLAAWMSVSFVCCILWGRETYASVLSLVQKSPTECGVPECDREAPIMRRSCPTSAQYVLKRNVVMNWRTEGRTDGPAWFFRYAFVLCKELIMNFIFEFQIVRSVPYVSECEHVPRFKCRILILSSKLFSLSV